MPSETNIAEDAIFKSIGDLKKKIQLSGNNLRLFCITMTFKKTDLLKYLNLKVVQLCYFRKLCNCTKTKFDVGNSTHWKCWSVNICLRGTKKSKIWAMWNRKEKEHRSNKSAEERAETIMCKSRQANQGFQFHRNLVDKFHTLIIAI